MASRRLADSPDAALAANRPPAAPNTRLQECHDHHQNPVAVDDRQIRRLQPIVNNPGRD